MNTKDEVIYVRIEQGDFRKLKALANEERDPVSSIVRRMIRKQLAQKGKET